MPSCARSGVGRYNVRASKDTRLTTNRIGPQSGIATKKKLTVGAKVVDSDYRNIPHAHLINNSDETVTFTAGDKVVQGIITPVWLGDALKVESVNENTERGLGGFGSTGDR